jgi:sulfur-oxidizing protein SoxX
MPRFGPAGLLDETQLKHLIALILDPKSPVNH